MFSSGSQDGYLSIQQLDHSLQHHVGDKYHHDTNTYHLPISIAHPLHKVEYRFRKVLKSAHFSLMIRILYFYLFQENVSDIVDTI